MVYDIDTTGMTPSELRQAGYNMARELFQSQLPQYYAEWNAPIGTLIERFAEFDPEPAAQMQAGLVAIHEAEKPLPANKRADLYKLNSLEAISEHAATLAISDGDMAKARARVDANRGVNVDTQASGQELPRNIPGFGLLAKMSGAIPSETINQLLASQAVARVIAFSDQEQFPDVTLESVQDAIENPLFRFLGDDRDPDYLKQTQALAQLTSVVNAPPKNEKYAELRAPDRVLLENKALRAIALSVLCNVRDAAQQKDQKQMASGMHSLIVAADQTLEPGDAFVGLTTLAMTLSHRDAEIANKTKGRFFDLMRLAELQKYSDAAALASNPEQLEEDHGVRLVGINLELDEAFI